MSIDQFLLSADTTDLNYPDIRPTLDLNFARTKVLDPRITFTRSSGGSYFGPDGILRYAGVNEARFDHNPTTGESLGLLVEEQRTNLLLRSEEFGTWWITQNASIATNVATSPSGAATADTLVEDTTATAVHQVYAPIAAGAGTYTFSVYAKSAGRAAFRVAQESGGNSLFTLSGNGTAVALGSNTVSISSVGNGWYRCSSTYVATGAHNIYLALYNDSTVFYTGDGTSGIYLWGAQLEAGAFPTSYIPTTSGAATRNADVASITGANFSSWYRQDEGTMFCDAKEYPFASLASRTFYSLENTSLIITDWHRLWIWNDNTSALLNSGYTSSSGPIAYDFSQSLVNEQKRAALVYRLNDFAMSYNGSSPNADTMGNLPVGIDRLAIGGNGVADRLNGTIRRLTYWPKRLPNAQLQALTR